MRGAVRSEVLRAVSGTSVIAVYFIALLMPLFVLFSDGSRFDLAGLDSAAATTRLLEPLAWSVISAAFVGAYAVTREYYYDSMDRTLTGVGFRRAFSAKLIAGALVAVALSVGIFALWTVLVLFLLIPEGSTLVLTPLAWRIYVGAVCGAVLGALIGGAIGWITRNYYLTAGIVLVFPMAVEFAMMRTAPDVAKFSPGLALVALSVPGYQGRLLEFVPALGVGLVWTIALVLGAWVLGRRRVA
ncbi:MULTISPECIES: ABC transporter permease [unclassified Microbacterium]|uniref:ABC transporter permease n=1 Tax=unclassified Microbacterium TaxID=2609290 RepID=UPI001604D409|nr:MULTISPECIES: ABC transporter permease [unclassified Microbacterium]QNA93331.1 ABC transporter permease [Microbacterium sp. Se63.02b]QYM63552.1 ABC transporter permease [Microbacterium sp. Se5.02b]